MRKLKNIKSLMQIIAKYDSIKTKERKLFCLMMGKSLQIKIDFYCSFDKYSMELFGNLAYSFLARNETNYSQLNDNINKLIDDLGEKMQKDLVSIEEKILLGFKDSLVTAQQEYRELQKNRNDEVIREKVLVLKGQQEKLFNQEELKSMEMNKLYDRIKIDLKKNIEYEHELELQIKFLTKQVTVARKKAELLDQQIKQVQEEKNNRRDSEASVKKTYHLPTLKRTNLFRKMSETQKEATLSEKLTRNRIETMKEYIELLSQEEPQVQKILGKFDLSACRSEVQKERLVENIFRDRQFKTYLYKVLFRNSKSEKKVQ